MASRGRWDIGRGAKKPRKEDLEDRFGGISPPIAPLPGADPEAAGPSAAPPAPPQNAIDTASPPSVPPTTVHEAAHAFTQLRVRTAPKTAVSPSASGAGQPSSPKKRKAAAALSGLAGADSTLLASDDARAGDADGDTAAGPNPGGPMGELLQVFGQIQLNKDFYDAIARTESCAGRGPRTGATQADADRAAFDAAVGAATAVLRRQVRGLAEAGQEASPAFLQAYALNAITTFATQAESSYSGEDLGSIDDPTGCSSVDRPSTATRPGRSSAERSIGNAPPDAAPPPPPPADLFNSFVLSLADGTAGDGGLQEQITSLERSASAMALQSPCESWGVPGRGGGPSASLLMREAADLLDTAQGRGEVAEPVAAAAEDAAAAAARRQRRRQRPASAEGEHESLGPQRQVRRSERPALGTVAEQRVDAPAIPAAVPPPPPLAAAAAAAPATPGPVGAGPLPLPAAPAVDSSPDGPAIDENVLVTGTTAAAPAAAPALLPPAPTALPTAGATAEIPIPRPQRPQAAPGHREKRDPRPSSSSGGPSHLSNDPPKRQRKGPGLVVGSAPGPGLAQPAAASRPGSAVASRGSVGGADDDRDDTDSGGNGSEGGGTELEPSAAAAPAAWGPSLVCADLTLHEVASQYWPSFKAVGKGHQDAAELSHEEQARVEELTEALERAILGAVGPEGAAPARRRLNAKVKSLAAASAFEELLRERQQGSGGGGGVEGLGQREESAEMPLATAAVEAAVPT